MSASNIEPPFEQDEIVVDPSVPVNPSGVPVKPSVNPSGVPVMPSVNPSETLPIIGTPKPPANLLDQLPAYDFENNQHFIDELKTELEQQVALNQVLMSNAETIDEYKTQINDFIASNSTKVTDQLEELKTLSTDLKQIVVENLELRTKNIAWDEMMYDEKYTKLAEEMKQIKKAKMEIKSFLDKQGMISPQ